MKLQGKTMRVSTTKANISGALSRTSARRRLATKRKLCEAPKPISRALGKVEMLQRAATEGRETASKMANSIMVEFPLKGEQQKATLFRADLTALCASEHKMPSARANGIGPGTVYTTGGQEPSWGPQKSKAEW